ncbi:GNAT family N-acetyltransferase [Anaerococcus urinomassiliensis]|uniref:GNAT family N-acetyltransferase n=1 Tax=Anaerococcus urinomassiliensis TaxID=1745712 RepID=UPI00093DCDCE|nr:GNAT family N-acetyltransferase [Anaerococcus urinomassiliensis]
MIIKLVKEEHEAQALDGDKKAGFCQYEEKTNDTWAITHTVVDSNYQGQGLASKLVDEVCEAARKENVKIIPICSYAVKKFDQEPEKYGDVDAR